MYSYWYNLSPNEGILCLYSQQNQVSTHWIFYMEKKPNLKKIFGRILQNLSKSAEFQAFYLQSQMDINPKSRFYNLSFIEKIGGFYILNDPIKREIISFIILGCRLFFILVGTLKDWYPLLLKMVSIVYNH